MFRILMADDDPDDCLMARDAWKETGLNVNFQTVKDGEELLDYLYQRGAYEGLRGQPLPEMILLDLNMPRLDGREALRAIRAEPVFKHLPVIAFTTSSESIEVRRMYSLGANSFLVKPVTFDRLVNLLKAIYNYWYQTAHLPGHAPGEGNHAT